MIRLRPFGLTRILIGHGSCEVCDYEARIPAERFIEVSNGRSVLARAGEDEPAFQVEAGIVRPHAQCCLDVGERAIVITSYSVAYPAIGEGNKVAWIDTKKACARRNAQLVIVSFAVTSIFRGCTCGDGERYDQHNET
jgi:hypothetical protein